MHMLKYRLHIILFLFLVLIDNISADYIYRACLLKKLHYCSIILWILFKQQCETKLQIRGLNKFVSISGFVWFGLMIKQKGPITNETKTIFLSSNCHFMNFINSFISNTNRVSEFCFVTSQKVFPIKSPLAWRF